MNLIENAKIRKVFDCRGSETVEVEICARNAFGKGVAPSGASVGEHEVIAYPKGNIDLAVQQFKELLLPKLIGMNVFNQTAIDALLCEISGEDFSKLGGSVTIATSIAVLRCAANALTMPVYKYLNPFSSTIPIPVGNVLGGGKHAVRGAEFQEFLSVPFAKNISEALSANVLVHKLVRDELKRRFPGATLGKGDEGSWVANLDSEESVDILAYCCKEAGKKKNITIKPGLDVAASEFFDKSRYKYRKKSMTKEEHIAFILKLVDKYGIFYLEDPIEENDFEGFAEITNQIKNKCLVVGDDLFATNPKRLERGISLNACNAVLIKPNQIGTITRTYNTVELAKSNRYTAVISHRSGETTDDTIAHLGVAFNCKFIKTGVVGGERVAKLNELIRIEEELK